MNDVWEQPIMYLKGVGPKRGELLAAELGITTFADLLEHFPRRYLDVSRHSAIGSLYEGGLGADVTLTLKGELGDFSVRMKNGRRFLTAPLRDETGLAELFWFEGFKWITEKYKPGDWVLVQGKPAFYKGKIRMIHPEMEAVKEMQVLTRHPLQPVYATTDKLRRIGLDARGMRKLTEQLLAAHGDRITEVLDPEVLAAHSLLPRAVALAQIHYPESEALLAEAERRLKFEELYFFELVLARRRAHVQRLRQSPPFTRIGEAFHQFYNQILPFPLTGAQKRVVREIRQDLALSHPMNRLVQGDVGSGKTIVAVLAALIAIDNGYQVALMAPTEVLAEQHYRSFTAYLKPLGLEVVLLTGSLRQAGRRERIADLIGGIAHIAIGTHALIEDSVQFAHLGLTIIDEQHKFGVKQRARLWQKSVGYYPHNLLLTATPIPRTLALTLYGDVDVSVIDELPPGRQPLRTAMRSEANRLAVLGFVAKQLELGRQAYVVYPLVEQSEQSDLIAVVEGHEAMTRYFSHYRIGIVYGKMKPEAKAYEMARFKRGETQLLVSTTVIEVGVDVPNATVMIVENAERFGLSQLHQLRGRVGRGAAQSFCILMVSPKTGREARKRLQALVDTNDGFKIAEVDLALRGPGDFLGTKQSGLPELRLADLVTDGALLNEARAAAFTLIAQDPTLTHNPITLKYLEAFQWRHNLELLLA